MKSKIFSIVLSGLVAVGLWLYVVTVESPGSERTYYNIPVILQNENVLEERGLMITSQLPAVTLTLSGTRTDLNKLDENNINILVNAASIEAEGTHQLSYSVSYPGSVSGGDISRVGQSVNMITVTVEKRAIKNVDVEIEYSGKIPDGFIADTENILMDYDTVRVSGPESVVSQITQAKIRVDLSDRTSTLMGAYSYQLCDQDGNPVDAKLVTTNVEKVNLTLKIQRMKTIPVKVEAIYGGGITAENSVIAFKPTSILVAGSEAQLANLDQIVLTLDFIEVLKAEAEKPGANGSLDKSTWQLSIELPEGVTNRSAETEVTIEITFINVKIKELSITKFEKINVPEGMSPNIARLEILVAGRSDMVDRIDADDITAKVDFSNALPGGSFPVEILVDETISGVGVVGTYVTNAQ